MADSSSPAFMPPMNSITEKDPMIIRVPLEKTDFAARTSQQPSMKADEMMLTHIPNKK